jgi:hypothetical protein
VTRFPDIEICRCGKCKGTTDPDKMCDFHAGRIRPRPKRITEPIHYQAGLTASLISFGIVSMIVLLLVVCLLVALTK